MKTVEDQLAEALAQIKTFETEAQGRSLQIQQLSEELGQAKAALTEQEVAVSGLTTQVEVERTESREQLAAARTEIDQLTQQVTGLTEANAQLAALEKDVEKRAALRAAQIAAETGSQTPARVTPAGDPRAGQPPRSAADVWNRQFAASR